MWLLADLFHDLPEVGDLDKPKLVFFFDEAHLLFEDASKAFLDAIDADRAADPLEGRRRLLRHPVAQGRAPDVLAQLGNRVQHALRAFTPGRRQGAAGRGIDVPEVGLRPRGAADEARDRRGRRHGALRARRAHAGGVDPAARAAVADGAAPAAGARRRGLAASPLQAKYGQQLDRESAYERLQAKLAPPSAPAPAAPAPADPPAPAQPPSGTGRSARSPPPWRR